MALRDQPYIPLYVQDFMTDEKLIECSAESTGVYIRVICLMHKSEQYGIILLKQKYKQSNKQTKNFAQQLGRSMPYDLDTIERSLDELITEGVLMLDNDSISQKRMIRDNYISEIRKEAGKKGGDKQKDFAKAKSKANHENENENRNKDRNRDKIPPKIEWVIEYCKQRKNNIDPYKFFDFYESKGWKVGREKMKDWEASVRTWEKSSDKDEVKQEIIPPCHQKLIIKRPS